VEVIEREGAVAITVRDDGVGFDPRAHTAGFGLLGMRERAELLGGTLEVDSKPGEGVTVTALLPLRRRDVERDTPAPRLRRVAG
jgi:signal transduction histidine kinase